MYTNTHNNTASIFDALRDEVPLGRIIEVNGTRKALCVSHDENTPSMHVYSDHVHCFSCGFHGDVVDVWSKQRGFENPVEGALDLAREFSVRVPEFSEEGRQKAEQRRQDEDAQKAIAYEHHKLDDTRAREWWEGRGFDADLQERFLLGGSPGAATIPLWTRGGRVQGVIERRYEGEPKYKLPAAEHLPGGHKPLFIPGPLEEEVFLVEGLIDALALAAMGKSAVAIGGTNASEEQLSELRKIAARTKVYILPDQDEAGATASAKLARALYPMARICTADYGEGHKDIADLFADLGGETTTEHLGRLVRSSEDILDIEMEIAAEITDRRERLSYVSENIAPLLAPLHPDGYRDATADIVAETCKLKKDWINKAIKDYREVLFSKGLQQMAMEAQAEAERQQDEYRAKVAEAQEEIDGLLSPGVLGRLRDTAAKMHQVYADREPLELALLVALGAQLEPLPNGRPLGASILLTAAAGRGKNHIVDAAVTPLPEEFYFSFEIASGQSLYYAADEDPDFLKHTFTYPNEIEGAETLWEFLRPMLSKGWAKKIVTAKDADGNMTTRTIIVEGPVTIAIPTIRNKTDEQLQTRLLVAELADYVGRVKHHSAAVSEQLLPDAATADYGREKWLWQEALRSLTETRRVVFPLKHPDFALDDDQISHGARLWANLLSLMATSAWLEQKNRRLLELGETVAIEATPDDYEAAYRIFTKVCKRTVVNISEAHRKILDGLHDLMYQNPERDGFRQREIAEAARVALSTVSDNKTFLVTSAKLIRESDAGLALVEGADPSWWETGELMSGLPTPAKVRSWWEQRDPDPPRGAEQAEQPNTAPEQDQNPHTNGESGVRHPAEQPNTNGVPPNTAEHDEAVRRVFGEVPNSENGVDTPNGTPKDDRVRLFGLFGDSEGEQDESVERKVRQMVAQGWGEDLARAELLEDEEEV